MFIGQQERRAQATATNSICLRPGSILFALDISRRVGSVEGLAGPALRWRVETPAVVDQPVSSGASRSNRSSRRS